MFERKHETSDELISIRPSGKGRAVMSIDLRLYTQTYLTYQAALQRREDPVQLAYLKQKFQNLRDGFSHCISGVVGSLLWGQMLEHATVGFSKSRMSTLETTPAVAFLEEHFIELVKNIMDESVLGYNPLDSRPITLSMAIDDFSDPDNITLMFEDTGRGFSAAFLEKTTTIAAKEAYIQAHARMKKPIQSNVHPPLFGGEGRGLRMLMANIMYGDDLVSPGHREHRYTRPETSEIIFENKFNEPGAVILITTSKNPLETKENTLDDETKSVLLELPHARQTLQTPFNIKKELRILQNNSPEGTVSTEYSMSDITSTDTHSDHELDENISPFSPLKKP